MKSKTKNKKIRFIDMFNAIKDSQEYKEISRDWHCLKYSHYSENKLRWDTKCNCFISNDNKFSTNWFIGDIPIKNILDLYNYLNNNDI